MYISIYRLCHEEGNVYLYLPSVAGTGNCISLFTACVMKREMYISIYRLWHEQGNVYHPWHEQGNRYLCLLPVP